jgi:hypothetical protein
LVDTGAKQASLIDELTRQFDIKKARIQGLTMKLDAAKSAAANGDAEAAKLRKWEGYSSSLIEPDQRTLSVPPLLLGLHRETISPC